VSNGIVVGYGGGKFGPNDDVTATQFAVMLMRALHIGDPKNFEGPSWETFAVIEATDSEIFDGVEDVDFTKPANREEAAQYAFNGLLYSPSGESKEQIYNIKEIDKNGNIVWGWIDVPTVAKDSLAALKYKTLKKYNDYKDDEAYDDLGRPSLTWKYRDPEVTIHRSLAKPVKVFDKNITQDELYKLTSMGEKSAAEIEVTVNEAGKQKKATLTSLKGEKDLSAENAIYKTRGQDGRGIITEIYKVGDGASDYIAVIIKPSFGKLGVSNTSATTKKGAFSTYSFSSGSSSSGVSSSGVKFSTVVDEDKDVDTVVIKGTVAKDNYCLYYNGADNLYIEEVDSIECTVTSVSGGGEHSLDDGKKISRADAYLTGIGGKDSTASDDEQTFFVDSFGNILGVKEGAASAVQLALVLGYDSYIDVSGGKGTTKYTVDIVDLSGVVVSGLSTNYSMFSTEVGLGYVCEYNVSNSGVYTFAPKNNALDSTGEYIVENTITEIKKGEVGLIGGTIVSRASNVTKFVVVNYKKDPDDANKRITDGTVTVYTGRNNVPSFTFGAGTFKPAAVRYDADGGLSSTATGQIADIVYIYEDVYAASESSYVYVTGYYRFTSSGYVADVIVEGKLDTITIKSSSNGASVDGILKGTMAGKLYKSIKIDSLGRLDYNDMVANHLDQAGADAKVSIVNTGGLLTFDNASGNYTVEDDKPVYKITRTADDDAIVEVIEAKDLDKEEFTKVSDFAYVDADTDHKVSAIYIIRDDT
jgi:hypothetical protein